MRRVTQNPAKTVAVLSQAVGPVSVKTAILNLRVQDSCTDTKIMLYRRQQTVLAAVAHRVLRQDHLQTLPGPSKEKTKGQVGQLV